MHGSFRQGTAWREPETGPRRPRLPQGWLERLVIVLIVAGGYLNAAYVIGAWS